MEHADSFWSATANPHKKRQPLQETIETDVLVIGAGFTGLAASYFLQERSISSIIIEANRVGWGASGRNAGMLTTGYKKGLGAITKKWGLEEARWMNQLTVSCIELVKELVNRHQIPCSYESNGSIRLAYKKKHLAKLQKDQEFLARNFDYPTYLVPERKIHHEIDSPYYYGGLIDPHSDAFHPLNYALGLADVIEQRGGKIFEMTSAKRIKKVKDGYRVFTEQGIEIKAKEIIVATNGYTTEVTKSLQKSIIPMGSHIVTTAPLGEAAERLLPTNRVCSDTKNFLYYFRRTPDNRILFGGRVSYKNKFSGVGQASPQMYQAIAKSLYEVFPQIKGAPIDYTWGGETAFTLDFFPHIGRMKNGAHYAVGFCGHGAAMTTLMGKYLADNVAGVVRDKSSLERMKLQRVPLHSHRSKFLTVIGNFYKIKDALL